MKKAKSLILIILFCIIFSGCQSVSSQSPNAALQQRPVIGITSVYEQDADGASKVSVNYNYVQAVLQAGGLPVVLPAIQDKQAVENYIHYLDGLVLIGGDDIPPSVYGQQPHPTVQVMRDERFGFESQLIPKWLESGKPILGVCLGMQFTNVMSGGTMIQDIPSQVGKQVTHRKAMHRVMICPGSRLYGLIGSEAVVYSNHHQAVDKIGGNLRVAAHSEDGVVEALEREKGGFGLFVQWHPEAMADAKHKLAIYGALVRACGSRN